MHREIGARCRAELYSAGKRPARVCGQAIREGRPGRVWRKKPGAWRNMNDEG
ncbi:MAG: hypothetical protein GH151_14760 [Bacteroidetes bacterium]|nr:hypothetical protein [Bacteroidota bacterium]